ncbi:MAG TPA: Flp pilus assembly protein CpaB [Solirubrobacterales bacterium]|nr:Flp pilus assembly protein CpaB [Solirubrobacterales bacterium]
MSRRTRAIAFLALALVTAALAAGIADSYGSRVASGYGPLRQVVVAGEGLDRGEVLRPEDIAGDLESRRVPVRFVPAGALRDPREALGLAPTVELAPGSYLVASQLQPPQQRSRATSALGASRRPVEISVSGAEALLAAGAAEPGVKVDVVVTTEPSASGAGRTYVAASAVPLLALGPGADGPGPGGTAAATLALTKPQALRLIAAESFARKLTLLPEG